MHADSSAARLGWPGRRAKASAGQRTVFPKCGAAFQGAFEGGAQKSNEGAQASKGGAAPLYVALANSLDNLQEIHVDSKAMQDCLYSNEVQYQHVCRLVSQVLCQ